MNDKIEKKTPDKEFKVNDRRVVSAEIVEDDSMNLVPAADLPSAQILAAVKAGASKEVMDMLERAWEFDLKVKAQQAKEAYHKSMAAFKANPPQIWRDLQVEYEAQGKKTKWKSADLGKASDAISKALGDHGLNHNWKTDQLESGAIKVTCFITHKLGHSESTFLVANPDKSGSKNDIQAIGSTIFYLERYTLFAITGLAPAYMDDDGMKSNGKPPEYINADQQTVINERVAEIYSDSKQHLFFNWIKSTMKAQSVDQIPANMYDTVIKGLDDAEEQKRKVQSKKAERQPGEEG